MNKLTAEAARQELTKLKAWENDGVLTLKEERYLQALEIALPILEQQERGAGWIEWGGGDCPVVAGTLIDVRCRDGSQENALRACRPDYTRLKSATATWWHHDRSPGDIIAYRILPEQPANQNGEQ